MKDDRWRRSSGQPVVLKCNTVLGQTGQSAMQGRWQVAGGRGQGHVTGGKWQVEGGRWQVACGRWPRSSGHSSSAILFLDRLAGQQYRPQVAGGAMAGGRGQEAGGRRQVACGNTVSCVLHLVP